MNKVEYNDKTCHISVISQDGGHSVPLPMDLFPLIVSWPIQVPVGVSMSV